MKRLTRGLSIAAACLAVATSSIASAEVASAQFSPLSAPAGARQGAAVKADNDLLGAPLFLVFLGALGITITTIIIVDHHHHGPKSP